MQEKGSLKHLQSPVITAKDKETQYFLKLGRFFKCIIHWFSFLDDRRNWELRGGCSCSQLPDLRASQLGDTSGRPGAFPGALLMT